MDKDVSIPYMAERLAVFFEPNGQMTVSQFGNLINARGNKYYDKEMARDNALAFVISRASCSPE